MFYKMLFDRFVGFAYLYTVLDIPRQIRIVCLHKDAVLCFVNNGLADKTSTEPGLASVCLCIRQAVTSRKHRISLRMHPAGRMHSIGHIYFIVMKYWYIVIQKN